MNNNHKKHGGTSLLPITAIQLIAALFIAFGSSMGLNYVAVFGAAVVCATLALQIIASNNYYYFISVAFSLSISFLLGDICGAGICLCAVPTGILLATMIKKKQTKISVSFALMIAYIVLFSALFLVGFALDGNKISVSAITAYFTDKIDALQNIVIEAMRPTVEEMVKNYQNVTADDIYAQFNTTFRYIKLVLPAYFAAFTAVLAYFTACFFKLCTKMAKCELILPTPRWETIPSSSCAWVYMGAYFVYFFSAFFSGGSGVLALSADYLIIMLTPVMVLMGIKWIRTKRKKTAIVIAFIAALFFFGTTALTILSFFGASETMRRRKMGKVN